MLLDFGHNAAAVGAVMATLAALRARRPAGARYTRGRGPLHVVLRRRCATKSMALRLEYAVKQLTPRAKAALVEDRAALGRIARQLGPKPKPKPTPKPTPKPNPKPTPKP